MHFIAYLTIFWKVSPGCLTKFFNSMHVGVFYCLYTIFCFGSLRSGVLTFVMIPPAFWGILLVILKYFLEKCLVKSILKFFRILHAF